MENLFLIFAVLVMIILFIYAMMLIIIGVYLIFNSTKEGKSQAEIKEEAFYKELANQSQEKK